MAKPEVLCASAARQLLDYDISTGVLRWVRRPDADFETEHARRANVALAGKIAGSTSANGYIQVSVAGRKYYAHRLAWLLVTGDWPTDDIDHKNGVRSDNRWSNLRSASRRENQQNRAGNQDTGASWHAKAGKWRSVITSNGRQRHLGYFDTKSEAAFAYREAKRREHLFQPSVRDA